MPMISAWPTTIGLELGDEAAGGLPAAAVAVCLEQVGGAGAEADRAAVAHVGIHVGVEHPAAGHGVEEALPGQVAPRRLQHLVDGLVHAPHEDADVVWTVAHVPAERRLV